MKPTVDTDDDDEYLDMFGEAPRKHVRPAKHIKLNLSEEHRQLMDDMRKVFENNREASQLRYADMPFPKHLVNRGGDKVAKIAGTKAQIGTLNHICLHLMTHYLDPEKFSLNEFQYLKVLISSFLRYLYIVNTPGHRPVNSNKCQYTDLQPIPGYILNRELVERVYNILTQHDKIADLKRQNKYAYSYKTPQLIKRDIFNLIHAYKHYFDDEIHGREPPTTMYTIFAEPIQLGEVTEMQKHFSEITLHDVLIHHAYAALDRAKLLDRAKELGKMELTPLPVHSPAPVDPSSKKDDPEVDC